MSVSLFEAAPKPGGRTRSFIDRESGELTDNGPHLLIGAYHATAQLLNDCDISEHVTWQSSLKLPLWDHERGHFQLSPSPLLPFSLSLLLAVRQLPGHGLNSVMAMLRLAKEFNRESPDSESVAALIKRCDIPSVLVRDMLEPICLGAMNEAVERANARSFKRVLRESFSARSNARLGWFNRPLDQALIEPLVARAEKLGVNIHCSYRVTELIEESSGIRIGDQRFTHALMTLPAYAAAKLLGKQIQYETRCITNIHLWYREHSGLPQPLIGGIGTTGHWYFDITQMLNRRDRLKHLCAVISAEEQTLDDDALVNAVTRELNQLCDRGQQPDHFRIIREKRATVLVRSSSQQHLQRKRVIYAGEMPQPGDLPATIELAVQRAEKAVNELLKVI